MTDLEEQIKELTNQNIQLQNDFDQFKQGAIAAIMEKESEMISLQNEKQETNTKLKQQDDQIEKLEYKVQLLEGDLEKTQKENMDKLQSFESRASEKAEELLIRKTEVMQYKENKLLEELRNLEIQIQEETDQNKLLTKNLEEQTTQFQSEINELKKQLEDQNQQVQQQDQQVQQSQPSQIDNKQNDNSNELQQKFEQQKNELIANHQEQIQKMSSEKQILDKQLQDLQKLNQQLKSEKSNFDARLQQVETRLRVKDNEIMYLKKEHEEQLQMYEEKMDFKQSMHLEFNNTKTNNNNHSKQSEDFIEVFEKQLKSAQDLNTLEYIFKQVEAGRDKVKQRIKKINPQYKFKEDIEIKQTIIEKVPQKQDIKQPQKQDNPVKTDPQLDVMKNLIDTQKREIKKLKRYSDQVIDEKKKILQEVIDLKSMMGNFSTYHSKQVIKLA